MCLVKISCKAPLISLVAGIWTVNQSYRSCASRPVLVSITKPDIAQWLDTELNSFLDMWILIWLSFAYNVDTDMYPLASMLFKLHL